MDVLLGVAQVLGVIVGLPAALVLVAWRMSTRPYRGQSHGSALLGDALSVSIEGLQPSRTHVVEEMTRQRFDIVQQGDEDKPFDDGAREP